jgi:hypothetical protein
MVATFSVTTLVAPNTKAIDIFSLQQILKLGSITGICLSTINLKYGKDLLIYFFSFYFALFCCRDHQKLPMNPVTKAGAKTKEQKQNRVRRIKSVDSIIGEIPSVPLSLPDIHLK